MVKLIECPRDAMQGIKAQIPTEEKVKYINMLLKVGFDTIDFGSFVSPKSIPQMADTAAVLEKLDTTGPTGLLAIIANIRGAQDAAGFSKIRYLGYPFSISETFQQRNTNRGIAVAFSDVQQIQEISAQSGKELVLYLSMGFGNPYGDPWNNEIVEEWLQKLSSLGINIFSLSDTVGAAQPNDIAYLFSHLIKSYPALEIGAHFHSRPDKRAEKLDAAYSNGCRRFDSAMLGYGGCPMAADDLTGNISTESLISYLEGQNALPELNMEKLKEAEAMASWLFNRYH